MSSVSGVPPLSFEGNMQENWMFWKKRFLNYIKAMEYTKKDETTKCAQLLHYIGEEAYRVYNTFTFASGEEDKLEALLQKFEDHFIPLKNLDYERHKFFTRRQLEGETIDSFVTDLKNRALSCELGSSKEGIEKSIFICGLINKEVGQRLLEGDCKTLKEAINKAKIIENAKQQVQEITSENTTPVHFVQSRHFKQETRTEPQLRRSTREQHLPQNRRNVNPQQPRERQCRRCGNSHEKFNCPAFNMLCYICKGRGHFAKMCFKKSVHVINEVGSSGEGESGQQEQDYYFLGCIESDKKTNGLLIYLLITNL